MFLMIGSLGIFDPPSMIIKELRSCHPDESKQGIC